MIADKDTYSKDEVLEIIRQVIYYGDPEYYENGGCNKCINFPANGTFTKAKESFEKYALKK
jgi:hypothetical protein